MQRTTALAEVILAAAVVIGHNSLSVYLRDQHGVQPQGYGYLLTASAITVIGFQFWMIRVIKTRPQFLMMALGTIFYVIGFGMFGIVSAYSLFVAAVVIITVGEMIVIPTSQALAAGFARVGSQLRFVPAVPPTEVAPLAMGAEHG